MSDLPAILKWLLGTGNPVAGVLELEGEERAAMARRLFLLLSPHLLQTLELRLSRMSPPMAAFIAEILALRSMRWQAPREAPDNWKPPENAQLVPRVEGWQLLAQADGVQRFEVIVAREIYNHPVIRDGRSARTAPLLWIDTAGGYAHSASRLYRLGRKWAQTLH